MYKYFLAAATPPFLIEIAAVIAAASIVAYISYRFGLVPIVGFLIAGVLIGPHAFRLVTDSELVDATAEVGVILLLFTVGIEFSLEKLTKIKNLIFKGGGFQVLTATALTTFILYLFGVDLRIGIFSGFLIALSSTVIVLKLLGDKGETNSVHGHASMGLLIFQDLAVVFMFLFTPILAGNGIDAVDIVIALAKALIVIILVLVLARKILPTILEAVARTCSPELFLLSVIAICFVTAYLTSLAGVSVSLGAFLAGLIVSESRFSHHAFSQILPLQILFSATFFVSVGMLLDVSFLFANLPLIIAVVLGVLIIKMVTTGASLKILGYKMPVVVAGSLILAQIGEFSFVLEKAGKDAGLTPAGMGETGSQIFIASTVFLMALTPLMAQLGIKFSAKMEKKNSKILAKKMDNEIASLERTQLHNHVIVAGYGDTAKRLIRVVSGTGIPYVITTLNPAGANEAEADGYPVIRGDASNLVTLQHAGIDTAKMLLIADDDPAMAHRISSIARNFNPTLRIVVRTRHLADINPLLHAGADKVIPEELESVVQMLQDLLSDYNIPDDETKAHIANLRAHDYKVFRENIPGVHAPVVCNDLDASCMDLRIIKIHEGMPILERQFSAIDFDKEFNLHLKGVKRDGEMIATDHEFHLTVGDELVLEGQVGSFALMYPLLRNNDSIPAKEHPDKGRIDFVQNEITLTSRNTICTHIGAIRTVIQKSYGCEECLKSGESWVHLRICMTCGHVGCCDSSKNKHASAHFHSTGHPVMKSLEPGDNWGWCYIDKALIT